MAGFFNRNKDYSLAIRQAQNRGASSSEIDQLRRERQNKIDANYGGNDPYRGRNDIMGPSSWAKRDHDNQVISKPGGTLYRPDGRPAVHNMGQSWRPGVDYAAEAQKYAAQGDWDAVDDVLRRRQDKINAQGGNDRGLSNLQLWNQLRGQHGYPVYGGGGQPSGGTVRPGGGGYRPGGSYEGFGGNPNSYLEELYRQQQAAAEAQLKARFEADSAQVRAHMASMDDFYDNLRNQQAAQNELERLRMNELGVASGLNTGTFGQLALGQSGLYQNEFAGIGRQQAADKAESQWKLQQLESAYRSAVEESRAKGQADLMDALYREFTRQMEVREQQRREERERQEREERYRRELAEQGRKEALERAKLLAGHGDFSGYEALGYSADEREAMRREWVRTHLK